MPVKRKSLLALWGIVVIFSLLACNAVTGSGSNVNNVDSTDSGANANGIIDPGAADLTAFWESALSGSDSSSQDDSSDGNGNGSDPAPTSPSSGSTPVPGGGGSLDLTAVPTSGVTISEEGVVTLYFDPASTPTTTDARSGPDVEAKYVASPPIIDGDFTDWTGNMYSMNNIVYGDGYYANEADLSGIFQIGWDEDALYLGVVVRDSRFVQTASGSQLFRGDGVEIVFDTDLSGDFYSDALSSDDYQIGFSPGNLLQSTAPEAYIWYPNNQEGPTSQINIAAQLTGRGYVMEMKVPWSVFGISPVSGSRFGFVISINDNDSVGAVQQQSVASFGFQRTLLDPTGWYNLVLISE